jgi:hypothetical protein
MRPRCQKVRNAEGTVSVSDRFCMPTPDYGVLAGVPLGAGSACGNGAHLAAATAFTVAAIISVSRTRLTPPPIAARPGP